VNKAKVEPKTVQGILRHRKDSDDARSVHAGRQRRNTGGAERVSDGARREQFYGAVSCGLDCGLRFLAQHPVTY